MTGRACGLALLLIVTLAAPLAGCATLPGGGPPASPGPPSGIRGSVVLGPTCPVESAPGAHDPVPCLTPYAAQLVILDRENAVVARVASRADGSFSVDLPPGEYVIAPQSGDPFPVAQPLSVTVSAGQYSEVQVNYDTGIR